MPVFEPLLLSAAHLHTFDGAHALTNASSFFFARNERLFIVTSRHVMIDEPSGHFPDRIEIEVHTDADNLAKSMMFSIPLYRDGRNLWRQGTDAAGDIDVAVIEIERETLPETITYQAFTTEHLLRPGEQIEIGSSLLLGFPLGFHDNLHHMPVVRQAVLASSFGLRFQGLGYFLTDARTHRGTSGSPVVMRIPKMQSSQSNLPWCLLGIHSARLDLGSRDMKLDEALGLNCTWYADILPVLTEN